MKSASDLTLPPLSSNADASASGTPGPACRPTSTRTAAADTAVFSPLRSVMTYSPPAMLAH
jgi:hypothetical protein